MKEERYCICGCGKSKKVLVSDKWAYFRRHWNWAKGLNKYTDPRLTSISKTLKGRKITWGRKISFSKLAYYRSLKEKGESFNAWNKGIPCSSKHREAIRNGMNKKEVREKISKSRGNWWKNVGIKFNKEQRKIWGNQKEKNPAWKGGKSFEPYSQEFDNSLREQTRMRYGYKCFLCGCPQLENGRPLDVHHIDYDKKNSSSENLIALCKQCHSKTNFNRAYWMEFFFESRNMRSIKT